MVRSGDSVRPTTDQERHLLPPSLSGEPAGACAHAYPDAGSHTGANSNATANSNANSNAQPGTHGDSGSESCCFARSHAESRGMSQWLACIPTYSRNNALH